MNFKSIGKDVIIWPLAKLVFSELIEIGNSVIIDDFTFIVGGEYTSIGNFIHIASFVSITGGGKFIIEDFSNIGTGSKILTGTDDFLGGSLSNGAVPMEYRNVTRSIVHIKKFSAIGANTTILPGVTIGEGAAIGANSLITKDCEPWTVYYGSPVKPIKDRPKSIILRMEEEIRSKCFDKEGNYISWKT